MVKEYSLIFVESNLINHLKPRIMNKERLEYLTELAEDYGVDLNTVITMAEMLGENEDYDGLVTSLEDMGDGIF